MHKTFHIEGGNFPNAGTISDQVKKTLKEAGFPNSIIRRIAIATFEAEMNVICYAKQGELSLFITPHSLKVVVDDEGHGILDINLAMSEGYSTADEKIRELGFGAGMGLPNIKKNTDEMILTSKFKQGTHLEFVVYLDRQETHLPFE
ncbi:MAG: anti-sigma regulatory factor [Syntrophaceae bacterium]|nr:anti-sigma regulatory factor [Syntrophaceae bacterium]